MPSPTGPSSQPFADANSSDAFDDFAALRPEQPQPAFPDFDDDDDEEEDIATRLGWGNDGSRDQGHERKPFTKYYLFAGAGAVVILVVVAVIMLLQSDPPELSTTPREVPTAPESAGPTQPRAQIDLKEPKITGNKVVLTWTSNPETLDFTVLVTKGTEHEQPVFVERAHTWSTTIDVSSPYCFQIRANNSDPADQTFYRSQTRSVNGSSCRH
ncbi:hypothetical protein [Labedaea rhizosphaerae]|uniref:Uncharacterized protein n=1 Tax=Labedaea rhizosphaerae TaxID=598644 RepID=A0A4R6SMM4_LABRH|nr:hypothetical protein [Labedaea rhizosphaerae]TDQ04423.1 hypothetical protein EV186_101375 [Labedaea rhizosphaerae]